MKLLHRIGLATLVFAVALSLSPAAQAWQSGRWTKALRSTVVPQLVVAGAVSQAVRYGSDWVDVSAALKSVRFPKSVSLPKTTPRDSRGAAGGEGTSPAPSVRGAVSVSATPARLASTVWRPAAGLRVRQHRSRPVARSFSLLRVRRPTERSRSVVTPSPTETTSPTPSAIPTPSASPSPEPTPSATPSLSPEPAPTAAQTLAQGAVTVPSHATKTQIDTCLAKAVAAGAGTWVVFPAGTYAYAGTFIVPDGINVRGQGIWDQAAADGGRGTWLQCANGMQWGSHSTIEYLLVGKNSGSTCTFRPVSRGSSAAGQFTRSHGSQGCTFNFVRFKGGSDSGASLIDLGGNFGNGRWSGTVKTCDMIDTTWNDCEFERPQVSNATAGTSRGAIMNIWLDSRAGGAQCYGNGWYRCHFGVRNGYHSGVDGYGIGRTILFQPAPAEHATDGPRPSGQANNMNFDWTQVDHGFTDNRFQDCLFEYSLWYPMDVCDYARSYALTSLFGGVVGSNPPTTAQAAAIPGKMWTSGLSMTRCYFKGSYPTAHSVVFEIGHSCRILSSFSGSGGFGLHSGAYCNTVSGSFSNTSRARTAALTTDWTGTQTAYTPSPYDP